MVQDPVVITFDADGRLWVVEMRGFMPTIDGEGENKRGGPRIGTGRYQRRRADGRQYHLPRQPGDATRPALVPGGALVAENGALWLTKEPER